MGMLANVWRAAILGLLLQCSASPALAGWVTVFNDEFTKPGVNYMKWSTEGFNAPQPINRQIHWDSPIAFGWYDNKIHLIARKQRMGGRDYTSGFLATLNHFHFTYGYVEVRAKFPVGRGFWPAVWLLQADKSWPPEIDIIENLGHEPRVGYMTYHWSESGTKKQLGKRFDRADLSNWHTYAIDWSPGRIIWYLDGKETFRVAGPQVPSKSMYVIANLAVGGSWAGPPDVSTPVTGRMMLDYVRIYQRRGGQGSSTVPPSSAVLAPTPDPVNTVPSFNVLPTTAVPSVTRHNSPVKLATQIRSNIDLDASNTVFYVRGPGGQQVDRKDFNGYSFRGLSFQELSFDFITFSDSVPGMHSVDVGIFTSDWKLLRWAGSIGSFKVE